MFRPGYDPNRTEQNRTEQNRITAPFLLMAYTLINSFV